MTRESFVIIKKSLFTALIFLLIFASCNSTKQDTYSVESINNKNEVNLVFLGDVMAHTGNFIMKDYNIIWDGIRDVTASSDYTFANIEAPVSDDLPFMNYPNFNMQYSYPQAAIDAGINVMTVANNHTNDQFEKGIRSTYEWSKKMQKKYKDSERPVYYSGLKQDISTIQNASKSEVSFAAFEKNGINFLFLGVTQLLNTPSCSQMINFFPSTQKGKKALIETVKKLREENPCDVFILALHTDEPEYVLNVTAAQKKLYNDLLDAGIDILWANHPHTPKPVEYIADRETGEIRKAIFYATGNTISAQRYKPNFANPAAMREYTGDGFCISLTISKNDDKVSITNSQVTYITTFVDENKNILIKKLNQSLYDELDMKTLSNWKNYLIKREALLKELKETTICR